MRYLIISIVLLSCSSINAQWRKVADFVATLDGQPDGWHNGEPVTCVYFHDLPGPPRVGFAGTESSMYKTTDGGQSWFGVWDTGVTYTDYDVTGICFKDSLTGWFSLDNGLNPVRCCYRTTNGGDTWSALYVPVDDAWPAFGIAYDSISGRLFLSCHDMIRISNDLGNTWPDSLPYAVSDYSFASPTDIITGGVTSYDVKHDTATGRVFLRSFDGGANWDTVHPEGLPSHQGGANILIIPSTRTCYMVNSGQVLKDVWRSDDFGKTWRTVGHLPSNEQYCTGYIAGNFSRLYAQTDSAMYVSADSGATWVNDGGPGFGAYFPISDHFYAVKGVTFAGMLGTKLIGNDGIPTSSLWEEIWPQSSVTTPTTPDLANLSVYPNPTTGLVTIAGAAADDGSSEVSVTNVLGESVLTATPNHPLSPSFERRGDSSSGLSLDLSRLPAGVYYITDGVSRTKLVKE